MPGEHILVSGATGHIGFRVLVEALLAGYQVRVQTRNESGIAKIKAAPSIQPYLNKLDFVLVPDIEVPGAWDEAVKGVEYVIHVASPIAHQKIPIQDDEWDSRVINPAVRGTLSLLESAVTTGSSIRRVVITSSVVAIVSWTELFAQSGTVFNEQSRTPRPTGPYGSLFEAYSASKVAAFLDAESFVAHQKPNFDVVHVAPVFTIGKNELVTDAEDILAGTNSSAFGHVLGKDVGPTPSTSVHVNDIAKVHVLALNPKVPGGQFLIGVSENSNTHWEDSFEVVKRNFATASGKGVFPFGGKNETLKLNVDNTYTKKLLGIEFQSYQDQVKSVTQHYLDLLSSKA